MGEAASDADLLRRVRGGDYSAYEVLWVRHTIAARRYAERLYPSRADDLVSESFVAILQQITQTDHGPRFAFRAYLKAVMRNTAISWRREAERTVDSNEVDDAEIRDGLSILEREAEAADVVAAFHALPERWQRVLWLAEVAQVGRPEIAEELGIKPNAVSALQRRARAGLKYQWLSLQVPVSLREDVDHVARLVPAYLSFPTDEAVAAEVTTHISDCVLCADFLRSTRGGHARLQRRTLVALLGSAGLGIPAASLSSATVASAAIAVPGVVMSGWLVGAVGVVAIGALLFPHLPGATPPVLAETVPTARATPSVPVADPTSAPQNLPVSAVHTPAPVDHTAPPVTGRWVRDLAIRSADLSDDPNQDLPIGPIRPEPADPDTPDADPSADPTAALSPGVTTPTAVTAYLAPVLRGKTESPQNVVVEFDSQRYTAVVADDGIWSFDLRALQPGTGTHTYSVWSHGDAGRSAAVSGTFTVLPLQVQGFEGVTGFEDMTVSEAQTTGLVVAVQGPPGGTVFITTMQGVSTTISIDGDGYALRRLLLSSAGWYHFTFRVIEGSDRWGPPLELAVDVYDPDVIFSPWIGGAEEMSFEFVDP